MGALLAQVALWSILIALAGSVVTFSVAAHVISNYPDKTDPRRNRPAFVYAAIIGVAVALLALLVLLVVLILLAVTGG